MAISPEHRPELRRIEFLVERDGPAAAAAWVRRTAAIYRRAVLDRGNFARQPEYRRRFIESWCDFRRWLAEAAPRESGR